jgi:Ca2+-binding RTX toxin-like protein
MKKHLLISLGLLALLAPASATAAQQTYTVLLAGGDEANTIKIWLAPGGRQYVIDSMALLEIGGSVCAHPDEKSTELVCDAPSIAGFEVNAGGGDDRISVSNRVSVPVTIRAGGGDDRLSGGSGPDKLIGGEGDDRLMGGRGNDSLFGGEGDDMLLSGPGNDVLRGGPGNDKLIEGPGADAVHAQYIGRS